MKVITSTPIFILLVIICSIKSVTFVSSQNVLQQTTFEIFIYKYFEALLQTFLLRTYEKQLKRCKYRRSKVRYRKSRFQKIIEFGEPKNYICLTNCESKITALDLVSTAIAMFKVRYFWPVLGKHVNKRWLFSNKNIFWISIKLALSLYKEFFVLFFSVKLPNFVE